MKRKDNSSASPDRADPKPADDKTILEAELAERLAATGNDLYSQQTLVEDPMHKTQVDVSGNVYDTDGNLEVTEVFAWLVALNGERRSSHFRLRQSTVLGRSADCDISLPDTAVSSRHAIVHVEEGRYIVENLQSTNGLQVSLNGGHSWEPAGRYELTDGVRIRLGRVVLQMMTVKRLLI